MTNIYETEGYPKIFKFGELSYKASKVRVRITDIKWGRYKDMNGNEVDFYRGNGVRLRISENLVLCSVDDPEIVRDDSTTYILYTWGANDSHDHNSAYYESSNLNLYKAFLDLQKLAVEEEGEEVEEKEPESEADENLDIEESSSPNF